MVGTALVLVLLKCCEGLSIAPQPRHAKALPKAEYDRAALGVPRAHLPIALSTSDSREGDGAIHGAALPPPTDLADEALLKIVLSQTTDEQANALIWKYTATLTSCQPCYPQLSQHSNY